MLITRKLQCILLKLFSFHSVFLLSIILQSFSIVQHVSGPPYNYPVDDLDKGDDAEAEKEAEESSKRGDEVHRAHPDAPLEF